MAKCPNCNLEVGNAKYCSECGTKIPINEDIQQKVDHFFDLLESASQETRDEFFQLLQKELDEKKKKQ